MCSINPGFGRVHWIGEMKRVDEMVKRTMVERAESFILFCFFSKRKLILRTYLNLLLEKEKKIYRRIVRFSLFYG